MYRVTNCFGCHNDHKASSFADFPNFNGGTQEDRFSEVRRPQVAGKGVGGD